MNDRYINGVQKSKLDDQITAILNSDDIQYMAQLGGHDMTIAIQNEQGGVYRVITLEGLGAYMHLTQALLNLDLIDQYADILNPGQYDSLFVFGH